MGACAIATISEFDEGVELLPLTSAGLYALITVDES